MWGRYLELSQQKGAGQAGRRDDLEKLRSDALRFMQSGFDAAREVGPGDAKSPRRRACIWRNRCLSEEKFAEAIELLEEPKVGPLTLVRERQRGGRRGRSLSSKSTKRRCGPMCP